METTDENDLHLKNQLKHFQMEDNEIRNVIKYHL